MYFDEEFQKKIEEEELIFLETVEGFGRKGKLDETFCLLVMWF